MMGDYLTGVSKRGVSPSFLLSSPSGKELHIHIMERGTKGVRVITYFTARRTGKYALIRSTFRL
jgi:hypothetical protein